MPPRKIFVDIEGPKGNVYIGNIGIKLRECEQLLVAKILTISIDDRNIE